MIMCVLEHGSAGKQEFFGLVQEPHAYEHPVFVELNPGHLQCRGTAAAHGLHLSSAPGQGPSPAFEITGDRDSNAEYVLAHSPGNDGLLCLARLWKSAHLRFESLDRLENLLAAALSRTDPEAAPFVGQLCPPSKTGLARIHPLEANYG